MGFDSKHPSYEALLDDWRTMDDVYAGERAVKAAGARYLAPTQGQIANGFGYTTPDGNSTDGQAAYDAYKLRAVCPDYLRKAVEGTIGLAHRKPPTVRVPSSMEPILERMTIAGESLEQLWRRVSEAQLTKSRIGLLVDMPPEGTQDALPYVALYEARTVINWDTGQREQGRQAVEFVVLDESGFVRGKNLEWEYQTQWRVLAMSDVAMSMQAENQEPPTEAASYVFAVVKTSEDAPVWQTPQSAKGSLTSIPFVFVNAVDLAAEPDKPMLLGTANRVLAIYRGEADYRQALHLQGQDTLVCVGRTPDQMALPSGAGAVLDIPMGGNAMFIGANAAGLSEQRVAIENDTAVVSQQIIQLLDTAKGGQAESGDALKVRVAARTASLALVQHTAAQAIKECLKIMARWMGLSDAEIDGIEVIPNLEFAESAIDAASVSMLMDAYAKGLPLSLRSIHAWLVRNGYSSLTFEEEAEALGEASPRPDAGEGEADRAEGEEDEEDDARPEGEQSEEDDESSESDG